MKKHLKLILIFLGLFSAIAIGGCTGRSYSAAGWPNATVQDGMAYVSYQTHVYAVDIASGLEVWRYPQEADANTNFYAAPIILESDTLVVGDYAGIIHGIDMDSGLAQWNFNSGSGRFIASPFSLDGTIFAPSDNQKVYAVSDGGDLLWDGFTADEPLWATPNTSPDCECVYVAGMDHIVYALNANTGALIWQTEPLGGSIVSQPAVDENGNIYVGTFAKELVALSKDGAVNWRFQTEDWVWTSPQISNEQIIIGDLSGILYAVNLETGAGEWQIQPGEAIVGDPWVTETGEIVFATEDGQLVKINSSGTIQWNQTTDYTFYSGPIQTDDLILVTSNQPDAILVAVNENGAPRWVFAPEK